MSCIWEISVEDFNIWKTECNNTHQFIVDGPVENKYKFCPYCGKQIKTFYEEKDEKDN
jgi:rRNA maturation endonuclease Nob1